MDLKDVFALIHKRAKILITITLVAILTSSILNLFILEEVYKSTLTLMVSSHKNQNNEGVIEYNDILLSEKLVDTYGIIAKSDRVIDEMITQLNLNISSKKLREKIIVRSQPEKRLIEVTIEDNDPQMAFDIANKFLEVFQNEIQNFLTMDNTTPIDFPKLPTLPARPNIILNLLISILGGIFSGIIVIYFVESLDNKIGDASKVERKLGIPVLATFPKTPQGKHYKSMGQEEDYIEIFTNLGIMGTNQHKKNLLITSTVVSPEKGEFIKDLSTVMAQLGKKVILLDCDFRNPTLHQIFNVDNENGLIDILENRLINTKSVETQLWYETRTLSKTSSYKNYIQYASIPNLEILPTGIVGKKDYKLILSSKIASLLSMLQKDYDMIIINTGSITSQIESLALSQHADAVLLVESYGRATFNSIEMALRKLGQEKEKVVGIVINNIPFKETKN